MTTLLASYPEARQSGTRQARIGRNARGRAATIGVWIAQIISAGMFLFAGGLKIGGAAEMVKLFGAIGIGQWFRYVTGLIEVTSGLLLLVPSLAFFGAIALMATMVGAIFTHLFVVGGNPAVPVALLAMTALVAWMRRPR
jgi:putative oxidoreductase